MQFVSEEGGLTIEFVSRQDGRAINRVPYPEWVGGPSIEFISRQVGRPINFVHVRNEWEGHQLSLYPGRGEGRAIN